MLAYYLMLLDDPDDSPLFCELYERYEQKAFAVALSILKNTHDAEDAAMSAWERIATHFSSAKNIYQKSCSVFEGWFVIIVKNLAKDELRRRKRTMDTIDTIDKWETLPDQNTEPQSELRALMDIIHAMPEKNRVVLELRLISECTFAAMGKALGCGEDAARMRYSRALDALRKRLCEEGYTYGNEPV